MVRAGPWGGEKWGNTVIDRDHFELPPNHDDELLSNWTLTSRQRHRVNDLWTRSGVQRITDLK